MMTSRTSRLRATGPTSSMVPSTGTPSIRIPRPGGHDTRRRDRDGHRRRSCHHAQCYIRTTSQDRSLDVYKIVLYRQDDGSWVAEVPAIAGCYALMPTRDEALAELSHVFNMIAEEFLERGTQLPEDTTEIVNA